jgi:hypothetical protein
MDENEYAFCHGTEYLTTRLAATAYLYNDWVRVGVNRSFGGAMFELYGTGRHNLIEEHGGSASQLSMWGYDSAAFGSGWFTTEFCQSQPYSDRETCYEANNSVNCNYRPATGAQISDCQTDLPCHPWSAGGPWNPLQSKAENCHWNGPTNDVTDISELSGDVTFSKANPYNFTKSTSFHGLTWDVTAAVKYNRPYVKMTYHALYDGAQGVGMHNQEIPAIFTDESIAHWYYYFDGNTPYVDAVSAVTRQRSDLDFQGQLLLPFRSGEPPQPPPVKIHNGTEEWMSVCNRDEDECLTIASFAPEVKAFVLGGRYVTALGRFGFGNHYDGTWSVYFFPYRFDDVVNGLSVRDWIYRLKNGIN